jgi:hypothetical protein
MRIARCRRSARAVTSARKECEISNKNLHHVDTDSNFGARILVNKQRRFKHGLPINTENIRLENKADASRGKDAGG